MADITEFLWDDHNIAHFARHKVTPADVSEVVFAARDAVLLTSETPPTGQAGWWPSERPKTGGYWPPTSIHPSVGGAIRRLSDR